jgi:signal transduction histidine kinase
MVSHEYRTPMTVISLSSALLKKYNEVGDKANFNLTLGKIDASIQAMNHLIDDVLLFGKSESGRLTANIMDVHVDEVCSLALEHARIIDKDAHTLEFVKNKPQISMKSDKKFLEQIIINLLTNACKYSPANEDVILTLIDMETDVVIKVKDFGSGIPEDEVSRLFEPFYRGTNSISASGTGLGLSIVKRSVELLGGRIEVDTKLGSGSEFTVILPKLED